jgi:hypothetical protein
MTRILLAVAAVAMLIAPAALADCSASHAAKTETSAATATAPCGGGCGEACPHKADGCCSEGATAATIAEGAAKGCGASAAKLYELAKNSGNEEMAALAVKAEGGCEHSKEALIAMIREDVKTGDSASDVSMAQLAKWADGGCAKSTGELIARAKASGDTEAVALATKAEGGCEHSKQALIARTLDAEGGGSSAADD